MLFKNRNLTHPRNRNLNPAVSGKPGDSAWLRSARTPQLNRRTVSSPSGEHLSALAAALHPLIIDPHQVGRVVNEPALRTRPRLYHLVTNLPHQVFSHPSEAALLHWQERLQTTIARSFEDVEEKQEASVEDRQGLGVPRRQVAKV